MPNDPSQSVVARAAYFHLGQLFCEIPVVLDQRRAWVIEANDQLRLAGVASQIALEPVDQVEKAAQACWSSLYLEAPPLLAAIWQCSLLLGQLGWFFRRGLLFNGSDPRWAVTDTTFFDTARLNADLESECFERARRGPMAIAGRDMNGYLASAIEIFNTRVPVSQRSARAAEMLLEVWALYTLAESHQIDPADLPAIVREHYAFTRGFPPKTQAQRDALFHAMTEQYERLTSSLLCDIHLSTWRPLDLYDDEFHFRFPGEFDETMYSSIGRMALGILRNMKLTRDELTGELGARLFRDQAHEYYVVLVLDANGALAGGAIVTTGRASHVDLSLQGQLRQSLLDPLLRGDEVIVIHNHPSGIGLASQEDVASALQLDRELAADGLRPRVHDLVIFAGGTVRSYAQVLAALKHAALPLADESFRSLDQRLGEWKKIPLAVSGDPRRAGEIADGNRRGLLQIALLRAVRKFQSVSFGIKADSRFYELAHRTGVAARAADIDAAHTDITCHEGRLHVSTALLDQPIQTVVDAGVAVSATFVASEEPGIAGAAPSPKSRLPEFVIKPRVRALLEGRDPTLRKDSWIKRAWRAMFG